MVTGQKSNDLKWTVMGGTQASHTRRRTCGVVPFTLADTGMTYGTPAPGPVLRFMLWYRLLGAIIHVLLQLELSWSLATLRKVMVSIFM